jgi:dihydrofolate reductase
MGKLVVSEFVSLDGVMEDPGGAEGFRYGGWTFKFDRGEDGDRFKLDETLNAGALLLGRVTYEGFAAAWPKMTDEAGFADKMNSMPKYVVSASLKDASWNNSTIVSGDLASEVPRIKDETDGDLLVAGSRTLAQSLMELDLVDELRLMVFPVVLGTGKRLFDDSDSARTLKLVDSKTVGEGIPVLTYAKAPAKV